MFESFARGSVPAAYLRVLSCPVEDCKRWAASRISSCVQQQRQPLMVSDHAFLLPQKLTMKGWEGGAPRNCPADAEVRAQQHPSGVFLLPCKLC